MGKGAVEKAPPQAKDLTQTYMKTSNVCYIDLLCTEGAGVAKAMKIKKPNQESIPDSTKQVNLSFLLKQEDIS